MQKITEMVILVHSSSILWQDMEYIMSCTVVQVAYFMQVGRCVGGLRQFGRGQKITFLPDISTNRGLPTFGETMLRGNIRPKKLFFGPCQNVSNHRRTFLAYFMQASNAGSV